eukprot:m.110795 g.110795  ORF g.110795 m.110795 type:complete len:110 (-) comp12903_c0_seq2:2217-2546(-)
MPMSSGRKVRRSRGRARPCRDGWAAGPKSRQRAASSASSAQGAEVHPPMLQLLFPSISSGPNSPLWVQGIQGSGFDPRIMNDRKKPSNLEPSYVCQWLCDHQLQESKLA